MWWLLAVMFPGPSGRAFASCSLYHGSTIVPGGQNLGLPVAQGLAGRIGDCSNKADTSTVFLHTVDVQ